MEVEKCCFCKWIMLLIFFFFFLDFYHFLIVFVCFLCVLCIFNFPFVKISNQAWNVNYFENDLVLLYLLKLEKDMYIRPLVSDQTHSGVYMKPFRDHQTRYLWDESLMSGAINWQIVQNENQNEISNGNLNHTAWRVVASVL